MMMLTEDDDMTATTKTDTVALATEMTSAWLSNPHTRASAGDVAEVLRSLHDAVEALATPSIAEPAETEGSVEHVRAVTVRTSLADPDRIISMIDGKPYASLKRHLRAHGLTPEAYRQRFDLKADYPMVAPGYSKRRSAVAKERGLGRKATAALEGATAAIEHAAEEVVGTVEKRGKAALRAARKTLGIRS